MVSWYEEPKDTQEAIIYPFNIDVMRQREARLAARDKREKVYQRRRRVAGTIATLIASTGLVYANGGPNRVVEGIKTLPAHIENVIEGPQIPAEHK